MKIIDNKEDVNHKFDMGQEVIIIQDFVRTSMGLNTFYKTCIGDIYVEDEDLTTKGIQKIDETSLEFVEEKEFPDITVVDFFEDADSIKGADLGTFDKLISGQDRKKETLDRFIVGTNEIDRIAPKSLDKYHLFVGKDDDGDFVYTIIPEYYLE